MTEKRYGMVIDTQHCVGCQTCMVSCKISNEVPGSAHWNHLESLDGEVLYRDGEFKTIDIEKVKAETQKRTDAILRRL